MHVQNSAFLGAATRPFCIKQYITSSPQRDEVYRTSGFPDAGEQVRPATYHAMLAEALYGWLPGEYRYRITGENGKSWEETLLLDFDEAGRYRLRSRRHPGQLCAFLAEGIFFTTNFEGNDHSLLAYVHTALPRVPCISEPGAVWHDYVSTVPFLSPGARWLGNLAEPFLGPFLLRYAYRLETDGSVFLVKSALEADGQTSNSAAADSAPREITCRIEGRRGVVAIEARMRNDRFLKAELMEYRFATLPNTSVN